MGWNHRVMVRESWWNGKNYISFGIHEVYYDEDGVPNSYTADAIDTSFEDFKGLRWSINKMKEGMKKPILWYGDKFPEEYKEEKS